MSQQDQLKALQPLVQAKYEQVQQGFQHLVNAEAALRQDLRKLDEMQASTRALTQEDAVLQQAGADVIWQAWLGRKKKELNMKLAQVLAQKEPHLKRVREAYGKVLVVEELTNVVQNKDKRHRTARAEQYRLEHATLFLK